jgi:hypothetical protein
MSRFDLSKKWYRDIWDGIIDEVINIRALGKGDQITLCKTHEKSNNRIFLVSKDTFESEYGFTPSEKGRQLMYHPITEHDTVEYVARIVDVLKVPGLEKRFWEELNGIGEFSHWEIVGGPMWYFDPGRTKKSKNLLWLLRVYKITHPEFALKKGVDFERHGRDYYRIKDSAFERVQEGFEQAELKPVIDDAEFNQRREKIKAIVGKYTEGP